MSVSMVDQRSLCLYLIRLILFPTGWSQEPVEGDDDEVEGVLVEDSFFRVVEVDGFWDSWEDGDVGRVGFGLGVVFVSERLEEIHQ